MEETRSDFLARAPLSVEKLLLPAGPALRARRLPGRRRPAASRAAKMAARWSSENVVVEFRDSQVAGAVFGGARWPFPGRPACSVPSRPSPSLGARGGTHPCRASPLGDVGTAEGMGRAPSYRRTKGRCSAPTCPGLASAPFGRAGLQLPSSPAVGGEEQLV